MLSIEELLYYDLWHFEMTRVAEVSLPFLVFDIDDSYEPIVLSLEVLIYSPLHTHEVLCRGIFTTSRYSTVSSSCTDLFESRRLIRYS
jgi:hypothetical protein